MDMTRGSAADRWWQAVRRGARAIREFNDEQVRMWEHIHQASRALVPSDGPLAWVRTLDGYQLSGSRLPAAVSEEGAGGD